MCFYLCMDSPTPSPENLEEGPKTRRVEFDRETWSNASELGAIMRAEGYKRLTYVGITPDGWVQAEAELRGDSDA